jgi:hypothetical protein
VTCLAHVAPGSWCGVPSAALTSGVDGAAIASRRTTRRGGTCPGSDHDRYAQPTTLPDVVEMADRADAVATDLPRVAASEGPPPVRHLVDLAAEAATITVTLLEAVLPSVDDDEPGTG